MIVTHVGSTSVVGPRDDDLPATHSAPDTAEIIVAHLRDLLLEHEAAFASLTDETPINIDAPSEPPSQEEIDSLLAGSDG